MSKNRYIFPQQCMIYHLFEEVMLIVNYNNGNYYRANYETAKLLLFIRDRCITEKMTKLIMESGHKRATVLYDFLDKLLSCGLLALGGCYDIPARNKVLISFMEFYDPELMKIEIFTDMQHMLKLDEIYTVDSRGWPVT
ncbi:MAG: hypothetical protein RQ866_03760 [Bacteroidales bacterium]|nr:hypothetical protein [Bacteroidales bacterium]